MANIRKEMPFPTLLLHLRTLQQRSHTSTHTLVRRCFMASATSTAAEPISPSNTRVGWIGTGVMGQSMCAHLIRAGYTLTVFNRTPSKAQPLLDMGAHLAHSPHALASQSDVVFSIVGYPSDVRSVLLHLTTGALSGIRPGGILVDMTTSEPSLAVEVAAAAASKNCHSIDAPVSGGDRGAKNGTLAIFAGGDEATILRLEPLFSLLGEVNYMGGSGKGQFAKLANQVCVWINLFLVQISLFCSDDSRSYRNVMCGLWMSLLKSD